MFGGIKIGDNVMIGVGSVVNKSFTENNITIAGIPARKIKNIGNPYHRELLNLFEITSNYELNIMKQDLEIYEKISIAVNPYDDGLACYRIIEHFKEKL